MPASVRPGETKNKTHGFYLQVTHGLGGWRSSPCKGTGSEGLRGLPFVWKEARLPRWALPTIIEDICTMLLELFLIAEVSWGQGCKMSSMCAVESHTGPRQTSLTEHHSLLHWAWERFLAPSSHRQLIETGTQVLNKHHLRLRLGISYVQLCELHLAFHFFLLIKFY